MTGVGLPEALERAASALPGEADAIRPANGDPTQLLELLDAEAAARVLGWLLVNEPADGAELAAAWAEDPERGAAPLLGVAADGLPKPGRKALRRVHHQLRSRGVEVPEAPAPAGIATLPPVEERLDEAFVTPVDPRGTRAVYLVASNPAGGARLFELLLDDSRGVLECRVYSAGRSKVRRFLREFTEQSSFPAIPAAPEAVRALVRRVAAAQSPDRPLPRPFTEWRSHVTDAPGDAATPGELAAAALGGEAQPAQLRRAAELVREGEVGPWPPPADLLEPLAERLAEVGQSQLVVSAAQRREQAHSLLEEALEEIFAEPAAACAAARFEETAYVAWKQGREEDARACLAASRAFRAGGVRSNPVALAMLEVVLAPLLQKLEEEVEEGERKSRLVEP